MGERTAKFRTLRPRYFSDAVVRYGGVEGWRKPAGSLGRYVADSLCRGRVQDVKDFPNRGGANGSIRFYPEINHGCNAGMSVTIGFF